MQPLNFPPEWPDSLCKTLEKMLRLQYRIRVTYSSGSTDSGYVGCTAGDRTLILRSKRNSKGGYPFFRDILSISGSRKGDPVYWDMKRDEPIMYVHTSYEEYMKQSFCPANGHSPQTSIMIGCVTAYMNLGSLDQTFRDARIHLPSRAEHDVGNAYFQAFRGEILKGFGEWVGSDPTASLLLSNIDQTREDWAFVTVLGKRVKALRDDLSVRPKAQPKDRAKSFMVRARNAITSLSTEWKSVRREKMWNDKIEWGLAEFVQNRLDHVNAGYDRRSVYGHKLFMLAKQHKDVVTPEMIAELIQFANIAEITVG